MTYKTFKITTEVEATDIQNMENMSIDDYKEYLESYLLHVDHHDVLRSLAAGYPIACTKVQLNELIRYLTEIRQRLKD